MKTAKMPLVLMYHSVDEYEEDPFQVTVTPGRFGRQLRWLKARGLRGVSMRELLTAKESGNARGLVGLTFDDGFADFNDQVIGALHEHDYTATVFVVAQRIGGHNTWDGGERPLMTEKQIREAAEAGMEVASHGLNHVALTEAHEHEVEEELVRSREVLQEIIGEPVTGFAYPYGHVSAREAEAVERAGYDYACAIWPSEETGRFALPRTYIGERDTTYRLRAKFLRHECRWRTRV
ncbi:polysaccharide deacetylase family protein [Actinocorallia longicatena]|uniref:Polysaccharide deacetylase family protein n=1 Tax=Actinocorallia longicatena TaxID=111803 RepID=A0ABP6QEQ3_9ACTN